MPSFPSVLQYINSSPLLVILLQLLLVFDIVNCDNGVTGTQFARNHLPAVMKEVLEDQKFMPNGCMKNYLVNTRLIAKPEDFPFRDVSLSDFEMEDSVEKYLATAEKLKDAPYKYLYLALYLLVELEEYSYLDLFEVVQPLDNQRFELVWPENKIKKKRMIKELQGSYNILRYLMAFYILGEYSIPLDQPNTKNTIQDIIKEVYGSCGIASPAILATVGHQILIKLYEMQKFQLKRDLKWMMDSRLEVAKDFSTFSNVAKFITRRLDTVYSTQQDNESTPQENIYGLAGGLIEIIRTEVSDTMYLAIVQYVQAICNTRTVNWKTIFKWRVFHKCKATEYNSSDMWRTLAFFGRTFLRMSDIIIKEITASNHDVKKLMYTQNEAWKSTQDNDKAIGDFIYSYSFADIRNKFGPSKLPGILHEDL